MKQLKTEQQPNNFQDLLIFEDHDMNKYCDLFTQEIIKIADKKPHLVGSVAKIFSGKYDKDYQPKDVDFAIDNVSFRKILAAHNYRRLFPWAKMVERRPERFIIYTETKVIELWNFFYRNYNEELKYHKSKIPYLCQ